MAELYLLKLQNPDLNFAKAKIKTQDRMDELNNMFSFAQPKVYSKCRLSFCVWMEALWLSTIKFNCGIQINRDMILIFLKHRSLYIYIFSLVGFVLVYWRYRFGNCFCFEKKSKTHFGSIKWKYQKIVYSILPTQETIPILMRFNHQNLSQKKNKKKMKIYLFIKVK